MARIKAVPGEGEARGLLLKGACPCSLSRPGFGLKESFLNTVQRHLPFQFKALCLTLWLQPRQDSMPATLGEPGSARGQKTLWVSACLATFWPELSACQLACLSLPISVYTPVYLFVCVPCLPARVSDCVSTGLSVS